MPVTDDSAGVRRVLVTGASGYVGGRLVPELLGAGFEVRCLARSPAKLEGRSWSDRVEVVAGDVADRAAVLEAMRDVDAAYYLVHSMGATAEFAERDRAGAATFRDAAASAGVAQLVYLGGLGRDDAALSEHLSSRHDVGAVLAEGPVPVTELRAAVIIGSGSASFEMLRHLTDVLPFMVTPRWVRTRCQPIAIRDVLAYLVGVLGNADARGKVLEIGGPDVVTYEEMMQLYADVADLRPRVVVRVPVLSPRLSSYWVGLVTPLPFGLARPLVDSLVNEVVVHDDAIERIVPRQCLSLRRAIELALARTRDLEVTTSWAEAELDGRGPADPLPSDPSWSGGIVMDDTQTVHTQTPIADVWSAVCSVGGDRGWPAADALWEVRGDRRPAPGRARHATRPAPPVRPARRRRGRLLPGRGDRARTAPPVASGDEGAGRGVAGVDHGPRGRRHPPGAEGEVSPPRRLGSHLLVRDAAVPPPDLPAPRDRPGRRSRAGGATRQDAIVAMTAAPCHLLHFARPPRSGLWALAPSAPTRSKRSTAR